LGDRPDLVLQLRNAERSVGWVLGCETGGCVITVGPVTPQGAQSELERFVKVAAKQKNIEQSKQRSHGGQPCTDVRGRGGLFACFLCTVSKLGPCMQILRRTANRWASTVTTEMPSWQHGRGHLLHVSIIGSVGHSMSSCCTSAAQTRPADHRLALSDREGKIE